MSRSTSSQRSGSRKAFTLIELLVVISIIALLMSLLLPALRSAQKTALLVQGMGRERQLAAGIAAYLADHNDVTPAAWYNNLSGNSPHAAGQPVGGTLASGIPVWDSIGGAMRNHLSGDPRKLWRDPAAAHYEGPDDAWQYSGSHPLSGTASDDIFSPNFFYMSTAVWIQYSPNQSWFPQVWATRNIANVNVDRIHRSGSEVLLFVNESTSQETGTTDIYHRYVNHKTATDHDNFAYLDGHVETKTFTDLHGYLAAMPGPISQTQFGINFETTAAWPLADVLPPAIK